MYKEMFYTQYGRDIPVLLRLYWCVLFFVKHTHRHQFCFTRKYSSVKVKPPGASNWHCCCPLSLLALAVVTTKVDGRKVRRFIRVKCGARISVDLGQQQGSSAGVGGSGKNTVAAAAAAAASPQKALVFPERLPRLRVVYEDDHLFAIM